MDRRTSAFLMIVALGAITLTARSHTVEPLASQFVSGVSLVEVYATVTDSRGELVSGLTRDEFIVEEDGEPQDVGAFAAGEFPLALAIAIDRSFSVSQARLTGAAAAVRGLLGELRPQDEVMLLAIGSENEVLAPMSVDRRAALDALARLQPWGTTPLHDAVLAAIESIQAGRGRRALIVLSDGTDRYSRATAADVIEGARNTAVLVYPVALARQRPPLFAELATITGGRSFQTVDMRTLPATLATIARELRFQYLLGYTPRRAAADRTGWRSIRVRVNRPNVRVRARDGYLAR
jgi:Ca-activated chloride channel family protein